MTISNYLAQSLKINDINTVFGIPSYTFMQGLYQLEEQGLNLLLNAHEQNAAHCAEGHYYATGTPAVVSVAMGPGITNTITGLASAYTEKVPILVLIPTAYSSKLGQNEYHSNTGLGFNIDEAQLLKSVTKSIYSIRNTNHAQTYIDLAIRDLFTGCPGPVVLSIPPELQNVELASNVKPNIVNINKASTDLSEKLITKIKAAWGKAANPIFMLGKEVRNVDKNLLEELLTDNCNYFTSYHTKGYAPKLDNYLGCIWYCNSGHIEKAVTDSDLVIAVGEDFTHFTVRAIQSSMKETNLIHSHSQVEELGRIFTNALLVEAPASVLVEALTGLPKKQSIKSYPRVESRTQIQKYIRGLASLLPEKSVFFGDVGNAGYLSIAELDLQTHQDYFTTGKFGSCGWSIGTSIGYGLAANKLTFAIIGDLSMNMNVQEMANVKKFGAKSNFILFNNSSPQNIAQDQLDELGMEFHTQVPQIDWEKIAYGYGLKYLRIESIKQFNQLSQVDFTQDQYLIEIVTSNKERPLDR